MTSASSPRPRCSPRSACSSAKTPATAHTDVVSLEARLLGIEESDSDYIASVRFDGSHPRRAERAPEPVSEVWNLSKPKRGNRGWLLAGVQQLQ